MRTLAILSALAMAALSGAAWSQANIQPDPLPRLPPQPGQGLPFEDVEFLRTAAALSRTQIDFADLAKEKSQNPGIKEIAQTIGAAHRDLMAEVGLLAKAKNVEIGEADAAVPAQGGVGGAASAVTNPRHTPARSAEMLEELRQTDGPQFDEAYLRAQVDIQRKLVDLYQTQASHTTDRQLATFAITTLAQIQQQRQQVRQAAREYGIAIDDRGQPPQYGKMPQ